jgi:hypothetical protein
VEQVLPGAGREADTSGGEKGGERSWGGECCKYCVHIFEDGKMRPVKTIP